MHVELVKHPTQLSETIDQLETATELSIDLEFDKNRFRYGFNLCLMQIAADGVCYVIDPLSDGLEISKLFPLLESDQSEKVVFAFGEDLRLLHALGCFPKRLFDLKTATSLLNYPPASLTNLLDEILDVQVGKSAQNSNWFKRPLTETQISYAAEDVMHLGELKGQLMKELREKDIEDWVAQENAFLDSLSFADVSNNELYRTKDKLGLSEYTWFVLKRLFEFRDELAKKVNRPSYQIIHKDYLAELANDRAALGKWESMSGIHRAVKNNSTRAQLEQVLAIAHREAEAANKSKTALAVPRPDPEESRKRRAEKAKMEQVKSQVFAPIKKRLIEDYGEHAATFMLSNRNIIDLISGDDSALRNYKRRLLLKYGEEVGVDVRPYL